MRRTGIVAVVVLDDAKDAVPTANALLAGGVSVMEITFRTAAAADSIKAVSENCPEMLVGAGTVVTLDQCKQALECGAQFIVSPGLDPEVVSWCVERNVPITPGCVTPTEIIAAMKLGLNVVKFFPGRCLRWPESDESIGRTIRQDQIHSDRRRGGKESERISGSAVRPRRRRKLAVPEERNCRRQF